MNLHEYVMKAPKIAVFGSDGDHCSQAARDTAYLVGRLLAKAGAVVFTGGGKGVMEAVSKGATEEGGIVIGILPSDKKEEGNLYNSLIMPTGIGFARSQVLTNSVDGGIAIEGGLGTREEAGLMYWLQKPLVAIFTSGGTAKEIAGKALDKRGLPIIHSASTPKKAVDKIIGLVRKT